MRAVTPVLAETSLKALMAEARLSELALLPVIVNEMVTAVALSELMSNL